jgi:hypothetical protein
VFDGVFHRVDRSAQEIRVAHPGLLSRRAFCLIDKVNGREGWKDDDGDEVWGWRLGTMTAWA